MGSEVRSGLLEVVNGVGIIPECRNCFRRHHVVYDDGLALTSVIMEMKMAGIILAVLPFG
jgi:hypothetical protein